MDLKTPLRPSSSSQIDPQHNHHPHPRGDASIPKFIVTVTFGVGNALALVPTSILRREPSTFRALALSVMVAFASACVSLLLIHCRKACLAERICRFTSIVAMAAVLGLLLYVSALLHRW
ncbi:hypothetical protein NL676_023706 [Syzygium grande]|nr:hypothetical protein NL676_023706 [Syzygium grande]